MKAKILLIALSMTLAACSSVAYKSPEDTSKALTFTNPSEDKVGIYVYRPYHGGRNPRRRVYIDGKHVATTDKCSFYYKEIEAGKHVITTESRFGDFDHVDYNFKGGQNYFIKQDFFHASSLFLPIPFWLEFMYTEAAANAAKKTITECAHLVPDTDTQDADVPADKMP